MGVALADGPRGLEATHVWTPDEPATSPVVLNDRGALPRFWLDRIGGFKSLPDADDNRQSRTARIGESPLPGLVRGKTITPEGRIQATSLQELRQQESLLQAALGERDLEGGWAAVPKPGLGDDTFHWETRGRVLQLDVDDEFTYDANAQPTPWQKAFLLGIRLSDPRWTWTDTQLSAENASQVTVTNEGTAPAELVVTVGGASGTVTVFNDTIGDQLRFVGLPAGDLVLDSAARTATIAGDDVLAYLDSFASTWWDRGRPALRRGANTIRQTGGSSVQVSFRHTSW